MMDRRKPASEVTGRGMGAAKSTWVSSSPEEGVRWLQLRVGWAAWTLKTAGEGQRKGRKGAVIKHPLREV